MFALPSIQTDPDFRRTHSRRRGQTAFTMVEIALCLAVIAFALVAIVGVLPTGLRVQKDNREDTIINQDGMFLLEAIRSQSPALDYLTNYFDSITVSNSQGTTVYAKPGYTEPLPTGAVLEKSLTNGQGIMRLLSGPRFGVVGTIQVTNTIYANVKAISGSAVDKSKVTRDNGFAFTYRLKPEIVPLITYPPDSTDFGASGLSPQEVLSRSNLWRMAVAQAANFSELRLTLQGPIIQKGTRLEVTGTPRVFRTVLAGYHTNLNLIRPNVFIQAPPP